MIDLYQNGLNYLEANSPQYKITNSNIGVVTATDDNTFIGMKTLYYSIKDKINFICYNLGMSKINVDWCKQNNINLINFNSKITIDKWQTYVKPFVVEQSPFEYTIWIDTDCVVTGNLSQSNLIQETQTFFTKHWINPELLRQNNKTLYELYPVQENTEFNINAGVFGINKNKDSNILQEWLHMVKITLKNDTIRNYVVNWDEGSLLWAIKKTKNKIKIVDENSKYNFFCDVNGSTDKYQTQSSNKFYVSPIGKINKRVYPTAFFRELLKQDAYICHLATCMENKFKYWKMWN